jgi:hypothetical protein
MPILLYIILNNPRQAVDKGLCMGKVSQKLCFVAFPQDELVFEVSRRHLSYESADEGCVCLIATISCFEELLEEQHLENHLFLLGYRCVISLQFID